MPNSILHLCGLLKEKKARDLDLLDKRNLDMFYLFFFKHDRREKKKKKAMVRKREEEGLKRFFSSESGERPTGRQG